MVHKFTKTGVTFVNAHYNATKERLHSQHRRQCHASTPSSVLPLFPPPRPLSHCVHTNFDGDNYGITLGSDKRFELFETNVGGDNHGIIFGKNKRFGLVDTNVRGHNHVITLGSDKRFELVDTNVGGDNHEITFGSDKRLGLVDVQ
jgi:hypothetical protein